MWKRNKINESFTQSKLILIGVLRKVSDELYEKGYSEDVIDNYINDKNIQLEMDDNSYTFYFNGNIMFSIELFPQLNDIINNASNNIIQWFENKIKNIKENNIMTKKQVIRLTESDLHNIITESVQRILNEYTDKEKAESKKKLDMSVFRGRYGNNNIHDYKGKAAMHALGAYGEEGEEVGQNDSGVGEYGRYDMDESIKRSLKEAISDLVQWEHFDNDRETDGDNEYYQSFVIVDGTRAVVGNYDNYDEAVEDAKEMAMRNKYGTYEVYGCDEDGYALEEDYPEDNTLVYSTDEDFA